jgi:glycopeptide antibiotics resistance protein
MNAMKVVCGALLGAYLVALFDLTLFQWRQPIHGLNLIPFATISVDLWRGGHGLVVNVLGNLAAFVPLGFLVPILRPGWGSLGRIAPIGAGLSLMIEALQYITGGRVADVDDVILDTLGAMLGYLAFAAWERLRRPGRHAEEE